MALEVLKISQDFLASISKSNEVNPLVDSIDVDLFNQRSMDVLFNKKKNRFSPGLIKINEIFKQ